MFINFSTISGLSINTYRKPEAIACDDVGELIEEMKRGHDAVCDLSGAKDLLEDGAYWNGSDVTPEDLEVVHALICDYEEYEE